MCDEIPNTGDPYEVLEEAKDKGWVPVLTVLAKLKWEGDAPAVDANHLHYLWGVDEEVAIQMAVRLIAELQLVIMERSAKRAREN